MNIARVAIFIDGGYLDVLLHDECNGCKVSYDKLSRKIAGDIEILRTYYYNCLPYRHDPPTPDEETRYTQAQKFHNALRSSPRFEVREGMLVHRGRDKNGQPIYVQKGVDVQLCLDLAMLSAKQQISHAAVITGDSDLIPAIHVAKDEGVLIHLYHGKFPHRMLVQIADERTQLTPAFLADILWKK